MFSHTSLAGTLEEMKITLGFCGSSDAASDPLLVLFIVAP